MIKKMLRRWLFMVVLISMRHAYTMDCKMDCKMGCKIDCEEEVKSSENMFVLHALSPEEQQAVNNDLLKAAREGDESKVQAALDAGACINVTEENAHGYTPLIYAIQESHIKTVTMLLERGADVNLANRKKKGFTPLMWSALVINSRCKGWFESSRKAIAENEIREPAAMITELLLDKGAITHGIMDKKNNRVLLWAGEGSVEEVEMYFSKFPIMSGDMFFRHISYNIVSIINSFNESARKIIKDQCAFQIANCLGEQDWLLEDLFALDFLGVKPVEKLVYAYACRTYNDELRSNLMHNFIEKNKEKHRREKMSWKQRGLELGSRKGLWTITSSSNTQEGSEASDGGEHISLEVGRIAAVFVAVSILMYDIFG